MAPGIGSTFGIDDIDFGSMLNGPGGSGMAGEPPGDESEMMREAFLRQLVDENDWSEEYQGGVIEENAALGKQADKRRGGAA